MAEIVTELIVPALAAALFGGIVGGGVIWKFGMNALVNELRQTFATKDDLSEQEARLDAHEQAIALNKESVDQTNQRFAIMEERNHQQWERVTEKLSEQIIKPLEKITDRMETISQQLAGHAREFEHVWRELERRRDA